MDLPRTPTELSADWLNGHAPADVTAGGTISSVEVEDIGQGTGIFGELARLHLEADGGTAPPSIVAKMACTEPANLEVAIALGIYERELRMYEDVLHHSTLNHPTCHLAARGDGGTFLLLLEDLSQNWVVGDQVVGATLHQAEAVIDAIAALHAQWWESPELATMSWLPVPNAPQYRAAVPNIYRAGLPALEAEWSDRVPGASIDMALRVDPVFEELLERTARGPTTLIHTDTRLDNIFFARDGSGQIAFIDFQLALAGRGAADVAYLVGTSVPLDLARDNWERLLLRWHDAICDAGITGYSFDDAVRHYREAALYYLSGAMSLMGSFDTGNERGAAMAEAYCTRILNHVVDIDADAVL